MIRRILIALCFACASLRAAEPRGIAGRIVLPRESAVAANLVIHTIHLESVVQSPEISYPDDYITWTPAQRHAWYLDFLKTDTGKAYKAALDKADSERRAFTLNLDSDRSFRAESIPPGLYRMQADIPAAQNPAGAHLVVTSLNFVTVPKTSPQPIFDLGPIAMTVTRTVEIGDLAPDFSVKTLDGKELKLSDFKGKFILLDFWATWCGPCVAETPALKAVFDAHRNDPRFAIVSLSLDESVARAQHFVEKNAIAWPQGFLGEWTSAKLPDLYGVHSIPANFFIDPQGKIVARDLHGEELRAAIENAMVK